MSTLFDNVFCLKAQYLRWNYDFTGLERLLQENKKNQFYRHKKVIAMYEATYDSFVQPEDERVVAKFQDALQLNYSGLQIEKHLLNAQLHAELAQAYADTCQQYKLGLKSHKKAEEVFDKAVKLYTQHYSEDWSLQRWFSELYIFIQYVGARMYLVTKSDSARDFARRALDMSKRSNSTLMRPHCYIILALCASRRRSVKNFEEMLANAKFSTKDVGLTDYLADYLKHMDKLLALHKDQVWDYRGKKLVEYTENEVEKIYRKVQNAKIKDWIDPEFRKKNLWGARDRTLELV